MLKHLMMLFFKKELLMSRKIIENNWNFGSLMLYYKDIDFRFRDKKPGDYNIKFINDIMNNQYMNSLWTKEELVFIKGNRLNIGNNILKSWIFNKNYNEQLSKFLDSMGNRINNFKNNHFSYYLSLFYILHKNWDMALLHLEKSKENFFQNWYNRGNFSNNLKHELINNIQKLNEVHDFLDISRRNTSNS